jgi:hypothetical protein
MLGLIRTCSEKLNVQLIKLRDQYIEQHRVVRKLPAGDSLLNSASASITYLEQLDTTLANAQDIRKVPAQV